MTTQSNQTSKTPVYLGYAVRKVGKDSFWTKIGAVFPHKDGTGLTLMLDALPIDGRVVLRAPKDAPASEEAAEA